MRLVFVLSGLALVATIMLIAGAILPTGLCGGATFLLTWVLIGLVALGALTGPSRRREVCLGAALFGAGFMVVAFGRFAHAPWPQFPIPTVELLDEIRTRLPAMANGLRADAGSITAANARIHEALKQPVPMRFNEETPFEDVVKSIHEATRAADGKGIPIYVDPIGLSEADKTMSSTVRNIELEGVPLRAGLRVCLDQLDLACRVKDGLLLITSREANDASIRSASADAFQVVGHCILALIAAVLGGLSAPLVFGLAQGGRLMSARLLNNPRSTGYNDRWPGTSVVGFSHEVSGRKACAVGGNEVMRSVRFSIAWLMTVVLILALGLAASAEPHRAVGWSFAAGDSSDVLPGDRRRSLPHRPRASLVARIRRIRVELLSLRGVLYPWMRTPMQRMLEALGPIMGVPMGAANSGNWNVREQSFLQIGHNLWALIFAILGGFLARAIFGGGGRASGRDRFGFAGTRRGPAKVVGIPVHDHVVRPGARHVSQPGLRDARAGGLGRTDLSIDVVARRADRSRCAVRAWPAPGVLDGCHFLRPGFLILVFGRHPYDEHDPQSFLPTVQFLEVLRPRLWKRLEPFLCGRPEHCCSQRAAS